MDRTPAFVLDMISAARELVELVHRLTLAEFLADRLRCLAAEKLFINLGEAARRVPPAQAALIRGVPWQQLVAARNVLAHRYEAIEHSVLYQTVQDDLPGLIAALEAWLAAHPPDGAA